MTRQEKIKNRSKFMKPKGLLLNDTEYRKMSVLTIQMFRDADQLAHEKKYSKLEKLERKILLNTIELLDYEQFRMKHK